LEDIKSAAFFTSFGPIGVKFCIMVEQPYPNG